MSPIHLGRPLVDQIHKRGYMPVRDRLRAAWSSSRHECDENGKYQCDDEEIEQLHGIEEDCVHVTAHPNPSAEKPVHDRFQNEQAASFPASQDRVDYIRFVVHSPVG